MKQALCKIILLNVLLLNYGLAQNLVINPSFEEFSQCPGYFGDIEKAVGWSTTSGGSSPDYFNACYKLTKYTDIGIGVPENYSGIRNAHTGNAYAGLALFLNKDFKQREYLQNRLSLKLEKGKKYKISFYVSLADSSEYITKVISCGFTSDITKGRGNILRVNADFDILSCKEYIEFTETDKLSSRLWNKFESIYTAKGDEEFLVIGVFLENMKKKDYKKILKSNIIPCAGNQCSPYYYIDDVSVVEIK